MNITIVGGGNIGTQFAVHCAHAQHRVTVFSTKPELFSQQITAVDSNGSITLQGSIACATADPEKAFSDADVIFVTVPPDCMASTAAKIAPHIGHGVKIGLIPGTGGGECAFSECIDKGAILFGLQRVPAVARLVEYGKCVCSTGYRKELHCAALPHGYTEECCALLSGIFRMPCIPLPNYLNLTLTPSNPILHTTRLKTLFKDYTPGVVYDRIPLFYEHWTDDSSELLLLCDAEVQTLCRALSQFDLTGVKSLKEHYESQTAQQLTKKISGIASFKGLISPQRKVSNGFIPDLASRYFTADFPYGLAILVQICDMAGVPAPHMKETLEWYFSLAGHKPTFQYSDYNIHNLADFIDFYNK